MNIDDFHREVDNVLRRIVPQNMMADVKEKITAYSHQFLKAQLDLQNDANEYLKRETSIVRANFEESMRNMKNDHSALKDEIDAAKKMLANERGLLKKALKAKESADKPIIEWIDKEIDGYGYLILNAPYKEDVSAYRLRRETLIIVRDEIVNR